MRKILLLAGGISTAFCSSAQYRYPPTKTVDSADTYWGKTYKDPYRWLEHFKDSSTVQWFRAQAAFSNDILARIPGRDSLVAEWTRLDKLQPPRLSPIDYRGGRLFYTKRMPGENVSKLYYRTGGMSGSEVLLFDPTTYQPGKTLSIQKVIPSWDGKMVVVSYSISGAEVSTIEVMDVATKRMMGDKIYPSWFGPISWTFDNKAFTYFSQKTGDNTAPDFELNTKTRLHRVGDPMAADRDFFSNESYPALGIKDNELPFAYVAEDAPDYIFADLSNVSPEHRTFYTPIDNLGNKSAAWKRLCDKSDSLVRGMTILGDDVYAITSRGAKNYRLLHTSLKAPDWSHADVTAPEESRTLESITNCKDYLLLTYSDGINNYLVKYDLRTKRMSEVKLPFSGSIYVYNIDHKSNDCYLGISSWTKPPTEFAYNAATDAFSASPFNKPPVYPAAYSDLVVEEVEVRGYDGVMIPLSIIHRKDLKKDGKAACLMDSYGAYGSSMSPWFSMRENSLAVRGAVIAYPHVRGGSEKGEAWYRAGYKTTKPNTWKDFNSCAQWLIAHGYTSAKKLAGTGTSAGGILISRAITERPDLYAAAICNVGCANAMRMEHAPNGPANIPEFGTVKDSVECAALYEMDGVQHVVKGTNYPAVICIGGWNDPRVIAWEPGKFAAALQNASTSGKPVLMKVNYDNGHFTEDKSVTFKNFADQYAFVMWQCGLAGFEVR